MAKHHEESPNPHYTINKGMGRHGGAGGVWFLGFLGTLVYFLHFHSGTFKLVVLAIIKAIFWLAYLAYYLLQYMKV